MSDVAAASECPQELMHQLAELAGRDSAGALGWTDELLGAYPADAKLYFFRGSLLAGEGRFGEALGPMSQAIQIDPNFHLARFQFGFLQLTSGDLGSAKETWRPLTALPETNALKWFVEGLQQLGADEFVQADMYLRRGIALNGDNPTVSRDMAIIVDQIAEAVAAASSPEVTSTAAWLIREADKTTRH